MTADTIDMTDVLNLLAEVKALVETLDGQRVNIEVRSKEVSAVKAEINRKLRYAAHLAEVARIDIMSQYYRFMGENPPAILTD